MSSRKLLLLALKQKETLVCFCYDHLPEVYNQFAAAMTHADRTRRLDAYLTEREREPERGIPKTRPVRNMGIFALGVVLGGLIVFVASVLLQSSTPPPEPVPTSTNVTTEPPGTIAGDGCIPSDLSELPAQTVAVIVPLEGATRQAPLSTLSYEHQSGLRLASGVTVDFNQMQGFTLSNPSFTEDFGVDVVITRLDCSLVDGRIQSESGSDLRAETEIGLLELHILKVKQVSFQWQE